MAMCSELSGGGKCKGNLGLCNTCREVCDEQAKNQVKKITLEVGTPPGDTAGPEGIEDKDKGPEGEMVREGKYPSKGPEDDGKNNQGDIEGTKMTEDEAGGQEKNEGDINGEVKDTPEGIEETGKNNQDETE